MKRISLTLFCSIMIISLDTKSDTYDPATNRLMIPSITVDGVVYSDVVITVGQIISIGSSAKQNDATSQRTCSFVVNGYTDFDKIKYDLTVLPEHNAIRVSMTGLTNKSHFNSYGINLAQDTNSTDTTLYENTPGALWQGDYGFSSGYIPIDVVKGGVISRMPSWINLNLPFKWVLAGEEHIC